MSFVVASSANELANETGERERETPIDVPDWHSGASPKAAVLFAGSGGQLLASVPSLSLIAARCSPVPPTWLTRSNQLWHVASCYCELLSGPVGRLNRKQQQHKSLKFPAPIDQVAGSLAIMRLPSFPAPWHQREKKQWETVCAPLCVGQITITPNCAPNSHLVPTLMSVCLSVCPSLFLFLSVCFIFYFLFFSSFLFSSLVLKHSRQVSGEFGLLLDTCALVCGPQATHNGKQHTSNTRATFYTQSLHRKSPNGRRSRSRLDWAPRWAASGLRSANRVAFFSEKAASLQ